MLRGRAAGAARRSCERATARRWRRALGIGACQALALDSRRVAVGRDDRRRMLLGLDRAAAARFSFFLAIPTMAAASRKECSSCGTVSAPDRARGDRASASSLAFVAALLVVKHFLRSCGASGFAPFAWYRIAARRS